MIVIIPSYNPDEHLAQVINEIHNQTDYRIIVVDDGSTEACQKYFQCLLSRDILLTHEINRGKGAAMKTAMEYIQNNLSDEDGIIFVDGDGQHKLNDVKHVAETLRLNPDSLVLGSRTFSGDIPFRSKFGNITTIFFFRLLSGRKLRDTQTGLRACALSKIPELLKIRGERYEYELNILLTLAKKKCQFVEVPIETVYENNANTTSHFRPVIDSIRIYSIIFKFMLSSMLSAVADYSLFFLFAFLFGSPKEGLLLVLCNAMARIISALINYTINRNYVFNSEESKGKTALQYAALACFILAFNSVFLYLFTTLLHIPPALSKVMIEVVAFFISFTVQQRKIF